MPSATFCSWQRVADFARKHIGAGVVFSIVGAPVAIVHALGVAPKLEQHIWGTSYTHDTLDESKKMPHVMQIIEKVCAQSGVRPEIRFYTQNYLPYYVPTSLTLPKIAQKDGQLHAIYIPLEQARIVERACAQKYATCDEAAGYEDTLIEAMSQHARSPQDMKACVYAFEMMMHQQCAYIRAGYADHKDYEKLQTPLVAAGMYSGMSRVMQACIPIVPMPLKVCAGILSIGLSVTPLAYRMRNRVRHTDSAIPATPEMKEGVRWWFGTCMPEIYGDDRYLSPAARAFVKLISIEPLRSERIKNFEKAYIKAHPELAKNRNLVVKVHLK
jgi:hypothetical protein